MSFVNPPGMVLPAVIDATTPAGKLAVIQGKARVRDLVLDGHGAGRVIRVVVMNDVPEFTVTVAPTCNCTGMTLPVRGPECVCR